MTRAPRGSWRRRDVYSTLLSGAVAACLLGCARSSDERLIEPRTGRPYRLIVPPHEHARQDLPLLFALHAYATEAHVLVDAYKLVFLSRLAGFVLVVPEGRRDALDNTHWNASAACCGEGPRQDDVAYLEAVLDDVARRAPVDRSKVAVLGVSNGAFMAQRWACSARADVAALVSVCGAFVGPDDPKCHNERPVSVLHVHGSADDVVRFQGGNLGGKRYPSAHETIAAWRAHNRCEVSAERSRRHTLLLDPIDVSSWHGPEATVTFWRVEGGDHKLRALRLFAWEFVSFLAHAVR